ncbi:MAG: UDP-3-O-(3-hydroxymyristoyl)glucosamine N-acyltransferase [Planctomycetota bacterium]|jgi:UDP-3-O-[3-hydroxymyristoyl] glucosamine N-acyltransferase
MKEEQLTAAGIAEYLGGTVEGDPDVPIRSIAALDSAGPTELTFAADAKYIGRLSACKAAAALVAQDATVNSAPMTLIRVPNVQAALAKLLERLAPEADLPPVGVSESATIAPDAELGTDVRVGESVVVGSGVRVGAGAVLCTNVVVGRNVEIGAETVLWEGVIVSRDCKIGDRVIIGPNSVIGYEGFGYYFSDGVHHRIPHIGNVVIADDVEIGASVCIDRAKFGSTRIGSGTKIDNLVQVGHNVQVGRGCILAGFVGIGGSAKLDDYVTLLGHVGIRDNISIGRGVTCGAYTGVTNDVPPGKTMFGIPAISGIEKFRQISLTSKLPEFVKRIRELEKRLSALESSEDH